MLEKFVEYAVKQIARHPEEVQVSRADVEGKDTISIRINERDRGRVIGRQRRTLKAMRSIISIASASDTPIFVTIAD